MHEEANRKFNNFSRRRFLKITGITAFGTPLSALGNFKANSICIVSDLNDSVAGSAPSQWAVKELQASLTLKGITVKKNRTVG